MVSNSPHLRFHENNQKLTIHLVYIISVSSEGLANDSLSEERREALARDGENSQEVQLRQMGSKAQLAKWIVYSLVLWLLKASLLHFFAVRLTVRTHTHGATRSETGGSGY